MPIIDEKQDEIMEKEDLDIRLLELMTGELTGDEAREMKRWVEESEEHRRYYRELQVAYARQRGVLRAGLVRRRGERRYRRVARRRMLWRWSGVAAAVCLVFGVSVWLWHGVDEPGGRMLADGGSIVPGSARVSLVLSSGERVDLRAGEGERLAEGTVSLNVGKEGVLEYRDSVESGSVEGRMNRLVVERGGEYRVVLSDGTEVWLNSETELEYPVRFEGRRREVRLKGEAYFKVRADSLHPFVVNAGGVDVMAVGTEFDVRARDEGKVEAVLVKGRVGVETGKSAVMLQPGELAVCDEGVTGISVSRVNVRKYVGWKDGDFVFSDDRLEDVMDELARWYDCRVFYEREGVKEVRLSADIKRYRRVDELLHFLELSTGVRFEIKDKVIFVK